MLRHVTSRSFWWLALQKVTPLPVGQVLQWRPSFWCPFSVGMLRPSEVRVYVTSVCAIYPYTQPTNRTRLRCPVALPEARIRNTMRFNTGQPYARCAISAWESTRVHAGSRHTRRSRTLSFAWRFERQVAMATKDNCQHKLHRAHYV